MIEEELLDVKTSRKLVSLGYNGHKVVSGELGGSITISCALRWLRERWRIAIAPLPIGYPVKWTVWLVYLDEPMEKDNKLDMCELGRDHDSYEAAAVKGIRHALTIVTEIIKVLKALDKEES